MGRWGVSPLPRRTGLKFVIGEPLAPPSHTPGMQVPVTLRHVMLPQIESPMQRMLHLVMKTGDFFFFASQGMLWHSATLRSSVGLHHVHDLLT